jgi:hypothetical protein
MMVDKYPALKHFRFEHLQPHLQAISKPFSDLAQAIAETLPQCAETAMALRKLLEAKDCAVRARLEAPTE